jgi:sugar/nucleoside kinase (ribokinase family)
VIHKTGLGKALANDTSIVQSGIIGANALPLLLMKSGLFVGLTTLDTIYLTPTYPKSNQKLVASDYTIAAGGPATNAAVAFAHLGNTATLWSAIGTHPMTALIRSDLAHCGVTIADLDPHRCQPPPISSIVVTQATGERAVVSINATRSQIEGDRISFDCLQPINIILIDGHQMAVSQIVAQWARSQHISIAIDAGSWKAGFEAVLPLADYVIASSHFFPPDCHSRDETFAYLANLKIPNIAMTGGEQPIAFIHNGKIEKIPVPKVSAIDTLGAGDIFHGAFCHFIADQSFDRALESAGEIAARSCQFFGTRKWLEVDN